MINGGPDPLSVNAMIVPSREVVVRFSPVDFTTRPPEYRIASTPNVTMATITTTVIRFIAPPALSLTLLQRNLHPQHGAGFTRSWEGRRRGSPEFGPCRHRRAFGA